MPQGVVVLRLEHVSLPAEPFEDDLGAIRVQLARYGQHVAQHVDGDPPDRQPGVRHPHHFRITEVSEDAPVQHALDLLTRHLGGDVHLGEHSVEGAPGRAEPLEGFGGEPQRQRIPPEAFDDRFAERGIEHTARGQHRVRRVRVEVAQLHQRASDGGGHAPPGEDHLAVRQGLTQAVDHREQVAHRPGPADLHLLERVQHQDQGRAV